MGSVFTLIGLTASLLDGCTGAIDRGIRVVKDSLSAHDARITHTETCGLILVLECVTVLVVG